MCGQLPSLWEDIISCAVPGRPSRGNIWVTFGKHYLHIQSHQRPRHLTHYLASVYMSNYDQLHRQCRTLENLFDSKLTSYSQLVANISRPGQDIESSGSTERWKDLELELDDLSIKVAPQVFELMAKCWMFTVRRNQRTVGGPGKESRTYVKFYATGDSTSSRTATR